MARASGGGRSSGAGSTTLPVASLYAPATRDLHVVEIGVTNTTALAVALYLCRLTTVGTQGGAAVVETSYDPTATPVGTLFQTHTGAPTLGGSLGYNVTVPGVVGGGIVWTFGAGGICIPGAVTNGLGILVATGTGQILDWYFVWDE